MPSEAFFTQTGEAAEEALQEAQEATRKLGRLEKRLAEQSQQPQQQQQPPPQPAAAAVAQAGGDLEVLRATVAATEQQLKQLPEQQQALEQAQVRTAGEVARALGEVQEELAAQVNMLDGRISEVSTEVDLCCQFLK